MRYAAVRMDCDVALGLESVERICDVDGHDGHVLGEGALKFVKKYIFTVKLNVI